MKNDAMGLQSNIIGADGTDEGAVSTRILGRILCVDDDLCQLHLRRYILEREGYAVIAIDRPTSVLEHDLSTIDLALLDYDMPHMNGKELFLKMRAARVLCPIVLSSGSIASLSEELRSLFSTCIDKGEPMQRVLQVVESYLRQAAIADTL